MEVDLDRICRLCLATDADGLVDIFDDFSSTDLASRISLCLSLEIRQSDSLPKRICADCRYQTEQAYILRVRSKNAESKLKRHLRLLMAGRPSHVFEEDDGYEDDCVESLAYVEAQDLQKQREHEEELALAQSRYQAQIAQLKQRHANELKALRLKKEPPAPAVEMVQMIEELDTSRMETDDSADPAQQQIKREIVDRDNELIITDTAEASAQDDEEEEIFDTRYDCDPAEYAAIEKAVKATLEQQPELSLNTDFQLRLNKEEGGVTKAEVTVNDGSILVMEFRTDQVEKAGGGCVFDCSVCSQEFTRATDLKRHMNTHHIPDSSTRTTNFVCKVCERSCASKSSLNRHMRTHTGEKPYVCDFIGCGKAFVQRETLKRHKLVHTGEKPYACTDCDKRYSQRDLLRQHVKLRHSEQPPEPYRCQLCPKVFQHASGLSRHAALHQGRVYQCEVCHFNFTDRTALRRHLKNMHQIEQENTQTFVIYQEEA